MLKLRVMTLNLGGGVKNFTGSPEQSTGKAQALAQLMNEINPDFLGVQEVAQYIDADGGLHSMIERIKLDGNFDYHFYGETLSMKKHMQIKKDLMINGLFNDWWDWSKGNAVFSRTSFARLGNPGKDGVPRNVPIFTPLSYEGTRDTDPRYVILTRLRQEPYPYLMNLHLTTLVGERGDHVWTEVVEAARLTRSQQLSRVLGLVEEHVLIQDQPLILMGDFNAEIEEYSLKDMLERDHQFVHLAPVEKIPTHVSAGAVDHIFFFPSRRLISYETHIVNSPLAHSISDHLPVVTDIVIE
ncbi:MAG: endonuclease/exonuclease/phosphatase family protein [Anaerolineaceae bacterium]|nr:endonuclease/exonuclease/phosphatase family protein [Anaerolineaceae bacterium]MDD4043555.1 endonuclease/exonuclease/phosphatase family protein [Anaerolineaceae bacterium]MDD4577606.1 endonuclease/exonuclease/phosphatase family protein [Anaerolineaceae bacterium]